MDIDAALVTQVVVNGFNLALLYILMALGFTLIFSILGIFNFAHGEFYMLGAFAIFYLVKLAALPFVAALVISTIGVGLVGVLVERFLFRPLHGQTYAAFMIALGLSMGFTTMAAVTFGPLSKKIPPPISGVAHFLGASISWQNLAVILISMALVAGLYIFIHRTRYGLTIRATASNPLAASLLGVGTKRLRTQIFGISTALAGIGGCLMASIYFISPYMGQPVIFKAMVVVILGGLGSIPGAIVGGLVLGFIESIGTTAIGGIASVFGWLLVVILLLVRPQGLLGKK